jgi:hypothetical protein
MVTVGGDTRFLSAGAAEAVADFRKRTGTKGAEATRAAY